MNKCVKIIITVRSGELFLSTIVQKQARKMQLEGTAQLITPTSIRIIVCGLKEKVDAFVDAIHKEQAKYTLEAIEVEPFFKDKDYRGIFRIIE